MIRDPGCGMRDTGCGMLDAGYWILDTGCGIRDGTDLFPQLILVFNPNLILLLISI